TDLVGSLPLPPLLIIGVIALIYIILGMFIEPLSLMLMTISVMVPVVVTLGYDPVWFGVVLVILLEVGMITPPVGIILFTIVAISPKNSILLTDVSVGSLPFVGVVLAVVILLVLFPGIVLWPLGR